MSATRGFRIRSVRVFLSARDIPAGRTSEEAACEVRAALERRYPGAVVTVCPVRADRQTRISLDTDEFHKAETVVRKAAAGTLSGDDVIA
jgi:hypothetical protein